MSPVNAVLGAQAKKVAVVQSCYIPWKGYFDIINMVDEFILFDDVQYTRRDWRNRNKIKTTRGVQWITIPVDVAGKYYQAVKDTKVADPQWARSHWEMIKRSYMEASCFQDYREMFEDLYLNCQETHLSQINRRFLSAICRLLGIQTRLTWSSDYMLVEGRTEKLVSLCKQAGATEYISGPSAKNYVDPALFEKECIRLTWMDYSGYPEYRQLHGSFEHTVSILDLLFNLGPEAPYYIWGWRDVKADRRLKTEG